MIEDVLNAVLARAEAFAGDVVKNYQVIPGTVDLDAELAKRTHKLPAIFAAFLTGQAQDSEQLRLESEIAVLFVWNSPKEQTRRSTLLPILQAVIPSLHYYTVPGIGTLKVKSANAMYSPQLDEKGLTLFTATLSCPVPMPVPADPAANIAALVSMTGSWLVDAPVPDGAAPPLDADATTMISEVQLPQPEED